MSAGGEPRPFLATIFAVALLAGVLAAWSPRYWTVSAGVACLAAVGVVWAIAARSVVWPPQTIPVAILACWGFLQLALHKTAIPWLTMRDSLTWVMCGVAFFLGAQILRHHRSRNRFLDVMLWAVTALAVEAMMQLHTAPVRVFWIFPADESVVGTMFYSNQFAALMELIAPVALWQILNGRILAGGLAFAAMFASTVASTSRAGSILMSVELVIFLVILVLRNRSSLKVAASALAILVLLVAGASIIAGTDPTWRKFHDKDPYTVRQELLQSTAQMVRASPWFGFGLGTWRDEYPRFATFDAALLANEAHNDWAQWAADGGLPFAFVMGVLVISLVKPSIQSVWGMGMISVMTHAWVDYTMRAQAIAFIWFAIAGALSRFRRDRE